MSTVRVSVFSIHYYLLCLCTIYNKIRDIPSSTTQSLVLLYQMITVEVADIIFVIITCLFCLHRTLSYSSLQGRRTGGRGGEGHPGSATAQTE